MWGSASRENLERGRGLKNGNLREGALTMGRGVGQMLTDVDRGKKGVFVERNVRNIKFKQL